MLKHMGSGPGPICTAPVVVVEVGRFAQASACAQATATRSGTSGHRQEENKPTRGNPTTHPHTEKVFFKRIRRVRLENCSFQYSLCCFCILGLWVQ